MERETIAGRGAAAGRALAVVASIITLRPRPDKVKRRDAGQRTFQAVDWAVISLCPAIGVDAVVIIVVDDHFVGLVVV